MTEWISVKDALPPIPDKPWPENRADVLCTIRCAESGEKFVRQANFAERAVYDPKTYEETGEKTVEFGWGGGDWDIAFKGPDFGVDGFDYGNGPGDAFFITHWMPVPEPAREVA